jgi:mannose-6-phosphate isomerase-like protein (cupin superfamily)
MAKNAKDKEERPWGEFEVLAEFNVDTDMYSDLEGTDVVIKKITVKPGQRLSYQSHEQRREKWVFVQGRGVVVKDDQESWVSKGSVVQIRQGVKHRIQNKHESVDLVFVEVCEGTFDEKDIIRYSDDYGRAKPPRKSRARGKK